MSEASVNLLNMAVRNGEYVTVYRADRPAVVGIPAPHPTEPGAYRIFDEFDGIAWVVYVDDITAVTTCS